MKTKPTPLIFISWSGRQSRDFAQCLKEFLCKAYRLRQDLVYYSPTDIQSTDGWFHDIVHNISNASIVIQCITKENVLAPWLHFESGVASNIVGVKKKIIPILIDLSPNDIPSKLTMLSHYQGIYAEANDTRDAFKSVLSQILFQIDAFMHQAVTPLEMAYPSERIPHFEGFEGSSDPEIFNVYGRHISRFSKRLNSICEIYEPHHFFLSRPMKGLEDKAHSKMGVIVSSIAQINKKYGYSTFCAGNDTPGTEKGISSDRLESIRRSREFIFIYPRVDEELPPSSCLIELGAALMANKHVTFFVEKGASLPAFFKDFKANKSRYLEFSDENEIISMWEEQIQNRIDCGK